MDKRKYEILRVPPNENSFNHAYAYIKAYYGNDIKLSEKEFWLYGESCYFASKDDSQFVAAAYIRSVTIKNRSYYLLSVATFDPTTDSLYTMYYDLIKTITKDKNNKPIIAMLASKNDTPLEKALKNLKFKQVKDSTLWKKDPLSDTPENGKYCRFINKGRFKKFNYNSDVDTVDKMVNFHSVNTETIAQDQYIKDLLDKNKNTSTSTKTCQQTEEEFMRPNPPCGCCYDNY